MFRLLVTLFILVPIVEIAVFIRVGDQLGLPLTLFVVILTAIIGVNLLKQQGLMAWQNIQQNIAQGQLPELEMAAAAQLLFAGGLLLTPGFFTDSIGFVLMIPQVRMFIAKRIIHQRFQSPPHVNQSQSQNQHQYQHHADHHKNSNKLSGRTIEGEFEKKDE